MELYAARQHFDYTQRSQVAELAGWFKSNPVALHAVRAPKIVDDGSGYHSGSEVSLTALEKRERIDSMDEIKRALEVAEQLPFRYLVLGICRPEESFHERKFENAMACLEHLRAFAKPLGVQLLLENQLGEMASGARLVELLQALHFDDLNLCFDLGHAHLCRGNDRLQDNGVAGQFALMKERIRSTHVHDNAGDRDHHGWPAAAATPGMIDWAEAMGLLRSLPQPPALVLEAAEADTASIPKRLGEAYQRLERAGS